jgi:hypothetical protein
MNGFNVSEAGHVSVILPPQNITGDSSGTPINPAVSLKNYKHASILVIAGAEATQDTTTLYVYACSSAAGGNAVAIPFNYYYQTAGGAGNDTLVGNTSVVPSPGQGPNNAPATGLVLAAGNWPANGLIVIEIDANELEAVAAAAGAISGSDGFFSYVGIGLGAPAAADYATVVAILSGSRYANLGSPTATT